MCVDFVEVFMIDDRAEELLVQCCVFFIVFLTKVIKSHCRGFIMQSNIRGYLLKSVILMELALCEHLW